MKNRNGFTLLELLIAAMLVAVLAMFATMAFKQTASDVRVQDAKTRADYIATAVQRFLLDNPGANWYGGKITNPTGTANAGNCNLSVVVWPNGTLQNLVDCGYLEYRKYIDDNFEFTMGFQHEGNSRICMYGISGKLSSKYRGTFAGGGYRYCTDGENKTETFGS